MQIYCENVRELKAVNFVMAAFSLESRLGLKIWCAMQAQKEIQGQPVNIVVPDRSDGVLIVPSDQTYGASVSDSRDGIMVTDSIVTDRSAPDKHNSVIVQDGGDVVTAPNRPDDIIDKPGDRSDTVVLDSTGKSKVQIQKAKVNFLRFEEVHIKMCSTFLVSGQ